MKKAMLLILALLFVIPSVSEAATKDISIYLDGKKLKLSSKPLQVKGETLVPSRDIFSALGAKYSYDKKTQTVKATRKETIIQMIVGQSVAFRNGEAVNLAAKPKLISGVLHVPLRFASASFGFSLNAKGSQIYIKSPVKNKTPPVKNNTPTPPPADPAADTKPKQLSSAEIGKLSDRVVYIEVSDSSGKPVASGSGVVVGSEGEILTNYHVIDGAASVRIDFNDQKSYTTSTLLLKDPDRDLALLKIDAASLPVVTIGDSSALVLGEEVVAIGSPLGFKNTLTSGVVSTTSREVSGHNFIQISAPIDHGSSGGALFNKQGQLVGITSALIESSAAINLAIPSSDVKVFLSQTRVPQPLPAQSTPQPAAMNADELTRYMNENHSVITYEDLTLHFDWKVYMSEDGTRYLIAGTLHSYLEWAHWLDYQMKDNSVFPGMIYYMSEKLHTDLGIDNSFFSCYLNDHFESYPDAFPSESISSENPGYRVDYNFLYGSMDYSTGYLYFNLNPQEENALQRMKMD